MIVNKYSNGGGGSGERGPQGYQGPIGPQGPQGEDGINQDPTLLKSVSEFPESAETGDAVAKVSEIGTWGWDVPYGEYMEEATYTFPADFDITQYDQSNQYFVGKFVNTEREGDNSYGEYNVYVFYVSGAGPIVRLQNDGIDEAGAGSVNIPTMGETDDDFGSIEATYEEDNPATLLFSVQGDINVEVVWIPNFQLVEGASLQSVYESDGIYQYDGTDWTKVGGEGGDNTILKSVSAAPETMELNDVAVLGNNLSQFTGYEDVVSAYTLVKMYNGSFAQDAGAADYVNVRVTENNNIKGVFTIGGSYITTPLGRFTAGSEVYTDWTDVITYTSASTGIMMKYDAGNDELDLRVPSGFSVTGQIVNKSGAELGDLSSYVLMTSEEEHFQGDPIYEQYAKRSELSDLSAYWTSAETQTAIQNEATQLVGYVDTSVEQLATHIPEAVSQLINDEEFVSSANLKTINNESIVGTGNISIQGGGDSHILKSSSGAPANLGSGDVYAITIPSADTIYGTTWTDSGEQNIEYDRYGNGNPQAIRISTPWLRFHWACEEYGSDTFITSEDNEISFENDGGWTEISSTHYVFDGWSDLTEGKCIHLEYLNGYFYFYTEDGSQIWIWEVTENESGNDVFEGEVTPAHGEYNYLYQADKDESGNTIGYRIARMKDLPSETRLLPKNPGDEDMVIYSSDAWRTTSRDAVFIDGLYAFQENWNDDGGKYVITRTDDWNFKWEKLDLLISNLKAVSALPVTTTDGDVIPYVNASGYGIVQAQSGTTGYAWVEGNTEMTGNTQIRVPYTSNDSGYIEFSFENSTDYHNLWWHYDDGNNPHWDGDNVPIDEQVDGEFSGQDGDGETITCVRSGDYLVVTFSSPVVSVNNVYNTEVYTETFLPAYKEVAFKEDVVTSTDIRRMVKISQADYTALAVKDPETMYVIIG